MINYIANVYLAVRNVAYMFNEIGKKIKLIARILVFAAPVISLIGAITASGYGENPWHYIISGVLAMFLTWPLYGFGQLVQDVHDLRLGGSMNIHDEDLPKL